MKLSILEYLVCPSCRSKLKLKSKLKVKNEIKEGTLICTKCNDKFKISKGIPRFVVDVTKDFVRTEMAFLKNGRHIIQIIMQKIGLNGKENGS